MRTIAPGVTSPAFPIQPPLRRLRFGRGAVAFFCAALAAETAAPPPAAAQETAAPAGDAVHGDLLRPGDVVRLRIWREPDLSGDFPVDEEGFVVFPKIGRRRVTNRSPALLESELLRAYRRYLRNPSIEVVLLRRVNILGAVRAPNVYSLDPTMTVADALALAGGATESGNPEKIEVYRNGQRVPIEINTRTRIGDAQIRSGDQIYVPERSWLTRNSGIATLISTSVTLFIALFIR